MTETAPDTRPNATEIETSRSARVTCWVLVRSLSGTWLGSIPTGSS